MIIGIENIEIKKPETILKDVNECFSCDAIETCWYKKLEIQCCNMYR